jgi:hypothetical protein
MTISSFPNFEYFSNLRANCLPILQMANTGLGPHRGSLVLNQEGWKYLRNTTFRLGSRNLANARSSICRIRSRVTENS